MVVSIIIFLLIFSIIVVSHEFGHYIIAKKNGIHSTEFFVGIGPKLIKWTRNGTEFSIRLLPFGGACVFEGVDELEDNLEPKEGSFLKASVWSRIATTLAGPIFNILLAYICGIILASAAGVSIPEIQEVLEDSGAMAAGLKAGDIITEINGHSIHLADEVSFSSYYSQGDKMTVTVERNGEEMEFEVTPRYDEEDDRYYMGIINGRKIDCSTLQSLKYGFYNVEYILKATVDGIKMLFTGKLGKDDLAGPVGIVKVVDDTYTVAKEYGFLNTVLSMVNIMLLLSANLAIMNLIPIPGLDGGRLLFLIIELIRRKPIPREKEGYVTLVGMALLLGLVVFVFFNDIMKFFR